jgi:hypothetical protein
VTLTTHGKKIGKKKGNSGSGQKTNVTTSLVESAGKFAQYNEGSKKNPYVNDNKKGNKTKDTGSGLSKTKSSTLASYLQTAQGKQRSPNENSLRMTTSFTPRTTGTSDFKRVAKELLMYAMEFDPDVLLLPWDDNHGVGPISIDDLANPNTMFDVINYYFDKPNYVNLQPGIPAYGIGVRFSTNLKKYEFINKWNIQKRDYKQQNKVAYTITMAATQKSNKAFIIGIAVGSSEDQDFELLNL